MNNKILFLYILLNMYYNIISYSNSIKINIYNDLIYNNFTAENFINKYFFNNFYTYLNIGNPTQNIPVLLKFRRYSLFILTNNSNENIFENFENKNYNPYLSNKFNKYNNSKEIIRIEDYESGIKVNDEFSFDKNKHENFNFIMNNISYHTTLDGILGLNINYISNNYQTFSYIIQLFAKKLIDSYDITLVFNKENNFFDNGYMMFGKNKYNEDKNFFELEYKYNLMNHEYSVNFDGITYGNNIYEEYNLQEEFFTIINFDNGFIYGSNKYQNIIEKNFFYEYLKNNDCEKKLLKFNYEFYICNDYINIKSLKNLNFKIKNNNFSLTLTYNDLFYKINNKLIFLVYFYKQETKNFLLGYTFYKKFNININQQKGLIGFNINKSYNENNKKYNNLKNKIFIFLLLFFLICFLNIIVYLIYKLKFINKKIRANELEENFIYIPQIK